MNESRRLLSYREAAEYCHLPRSTFKTVCPVRPVRLHERAHLVLDIKDLDNWIDSIKHGVKEGLSDDDIVNEL